MLILRLGSGSSSIFCMQTFGTLIGMALVHILGQNVDYQLKKGGMLFLPGKTGLCLTGKVHRRQTPEGCCF